MRGLVEPGTGINCKVCVYGSTCNTGRGHAYHVKSCVQYTEGKPKTNADRIRSMTDEELMRFLLGVRIGINSPWCDDELCNNRYCSECLAEWLKKEVKDG